MKNISNTRGDHRYDYTSVQQQLELECPQHGNTEPSETDTIDKTPTNKRDDTNNEIQEIMNNEINSSQSNHPQISTRNIRMTNSDDYSRISDVQHTPTDVNSGKQEYNYDEICTGINSKPDVYFHTEPDNGTYNVLSKNKSDLKVNIDVSDVYDHPGDDGTYNKLLNKGRQPQQKNEDVAGVYDHAGALEDNYNTLNIGKKTRQPTVDDTYNHTTE